MDKIPPAVSEADAGWISIGLWSDIFTRRWTRRLGFASNKHRARSYQNLRLAMRPTPQQCPQIDLLLGPKKNSRAGQSDADMGELFGFHLAMIRISPQKQLRMAAYRLIR